MSNRWLKVNTYLPRKLYNILENEETFNEKSHKPIITNGDIAKVHPEATSNYRVLTQFNNSMLILQIKHVI